MVVKLTPVMFDDLDLVLLVSIIGTGMEEAGVLIPLNCRSDFAPLLPHQQFCMGDATQDDSDDDSEVGLRHRQGLVFFDMVHEVVHDPTVSFLLVEVGSVPSPLLERPSSFLKIGREDSCGFIVTRRTTLGSSYNLTEASALGPDILKAKKHGFGDAGGNVDDERNVVRGTSRER